MAGHEFSPAVEGFNHHFFAPIIYLAVLAGAIGAEFLLLGYGFKKLFQSGSRRNVKH